MSRDLDWPIRMGHADFLPVWLKDQTDSSSTVLLALDLQDKCSYLVKFKVERVAKLSGTKGFRQIMRKSNYETSFG